MIFIYIEIVLIALYFYIRHWEKRLDRMERRRRLWDDD
jgi:hypothetical protein